MTNKDECFVSGQIFVNSLLSFRVLFIPKIKILFEKFFFIKPKIFIFTLNISIFYENI